MKILKTILASLLLLIGCDGPGERKEVATDTTSFNIKGCFYHSGELEIDGCEFVYLVASRGGTSIIHKPTCKNHSSTQNLEQ